MESFIISILKYILTVNVGTASIFGYPGDKWAGGDAICLKRPINNKDVGIAHRWWPCGTKVAIYNFRTNKWVQAKVVERGPYGATLRGKWVLKRRQSDPGTYRGVADLTPRAARLLNHNGFETVMVQRIN